MQILPCAAPTETLEPAPLTSLPLESIQEVGAQAFWGGDNSYYVRTIDEQGETWYRAETGQTISTDASPAALVKLGLLMSTVLPISTGRVAFPIGSTGRKVYRVWRARSTAQGRTKILGVRAARSRRLPA